jgi:hypothetical protein
LDGSGRSGGVMLGKHWAKVQLKPGNGYTEGRPALAQRS